MYYPFPNIRVEISATNPDGNTPLHDAAYANPDQAVITTLITSGANIKLKR